MAAICGICNTETSKYKCPRCQIPYCSIVCYGSHKAAHDGETETHPIAPPSGDSSIAPKENEPPKPNPTPSEKLHRKTQDRDFTALPSDPEFRDLLRRYPTLRNELRKIYIDTLPPSAPRYSNSRGGFGRGGGRAAFANNNWNAEKGVKRASTRVARSRVLHSGVAEGIQEFGELVSKLYGDGRPVNGTESTD